MNNKRTVNENNRLAEEWEEDQLTFAAFCAQRHVPLGGTFELTPRCNFRCKMCYVRLDQSQMDLIGRERTASEWISLAREAIDAGTLNLLITGGEPLIRDDFAEIYSALSEMGFVITLNTNAALMNTELLKLFKKYPPTSTNVTLYGASSETYEKIIGNPQGFNQTLRGLDMLSEVSTELEVRSTFIKDNMNELDELRKIANKYTKHFAINTDVNKAVRGACSDAENCRLTPGQKFDLIEANRAYYNNTAGSTKSVLEGNMEIDNHLKIKDYGFDLQPRIITCLAAKAMYWITWDGKMIPCGAFSGPYTLPFEEGFNQAWNRLPSLFDNVLLPQKCTTCKYADGGCPNCPAMLQSETGSFSQTSDYICGIAKESAKRKEGRLINNKY